MALAWPSWVVLRVVLIVSFLLSVNLVLSLACLVILAFQARAFSKREDRWWKREEELRNQLWELAGGKKPVVKIEREKIIKVPDPEGQPPAMNEWDAALFNDGVKEEVEQLHPNARGMSIAQVKAKYPHDWKRAEEALRAERAPLRA